MLQSLFEEKAEQEISEIEERKFIEKIIIKKHVENTAVPKIRYERWEDKFVSVNEDFTYVLNKVKIIKSNFGKGYLKLELIGE